MPIPVDVEQRVVSRCLRGRPMPRALLRLWEAERQGDLDWLGLLDSLDVVENRHGADLAEGSTDRAANVRAHRRIFERLGFFAIDAAKELLALDLAHPDVDDPPVVTLYRDGRYSWLGRNIADAIFQDGRRSDDRKKWLARHGLEGAEPGKFGASTQFLPSLADVHERYYAEERGHVPKTPFERTEPASRDPISWVGRPAREVEPILRNLLGIGAGPFREQWVGCDGAGNVATVWVRKASAPPDLTIGGIGFLATQATARSSFGPPARTPPPDAPVSWDGFRVDGVAVNVAYGKGNMIEMITLMSRFPGE